MADTNNTTPTPDEPAGLPDAAMLAEFECRLLDSEAAFAAYERDCAETSDATYEMRDFLDMHGRRLLHLARGGA